MMKLIAEDMISYRFLYSCLVVTLKCDNHNNTLITILAIPY